MKPFAQFVCFTLYAKLIRVVQILSPAIDMIDMMSVMASSFLEYCLPSRSSARGNSTLASAFTLTTDLRMDIQALGTRLEKAATGEEHSRRKKIADETRAMHALEIRHIIEDIKKLLVRIEDAVPLINLAITTSGASLSSALPASVSPSRLLQASTFLTAGDGLYSVRPNYPVQVGPTFTLSLYMLFAGHSERADTESMRDTTWKEVIHKARVKLVRVPLVDWDPLGSGGGSSNARRRDKCDSPLPPDPNLPQDSLTSEEGSRSEYAYQLEIIEDFEDDRVHSFEEGEPQPSPYGDVRLAGIRESLPIYQVSKIFYADTGKILNVGTQGETNNPVLLLRRDIDAPPPRRMMEDMNKNDEWQARPEEVDYDESEDKSQGHIDRQIRRESSVHLAADPVEEAQLPISETSGPWKLPLSLDPEWLALEVYTETEEESNSESGLDINGAATFTSSPLHREQSEASLAAELPNLKLDPSLSPSRSLPYYEVAGLPLQTAALPSTLPFVPPIRSSLSLLEMLIRLTALQQVYQTSHLAIPDEFLNFFLQESSTTGGDADERRRARQEARRRVGFDPYDESPIKHHGEDYQMQNHGEGYSRGSTPHKEEQEYGYGHRSEGPESTGWREPSVPLGSPESWLLRSREGASSRQNSPLPLSPIQPYRQPARRSARPLDRVLQAQHMAKNGSPLGKGMSVETDSTLGTSPGSPTLVNRKEQD